MEEESERQVEMRREKGGIYIVSKIPSPFG